jgi:hypothetical protein
MNIIIYCVPSGPHKTLWEKLKSDFDNGLFKSYTFWVIVILAIVSGSWWYFTKDSSNTDVSVKNRAPKVNANNNRSNKSTSNMYEDSRKQEMTSGDDSNDNGKSDDSDMDNDKFKNIDKSKIEEVKRNESANKVDVVADLVPNVQQQGVQAQPYQNGGQQYQGAQAQQYPNVSQPQVYQNAPYHGNQPVYNSNQPAYAQPAYAPQYPPRPLYPPAGYPYGPRYGY